MLCTDGPGDPCTRFLVVSRAFDCGEIIDYSSMITKLSAVCLADIACISLRRDS